MTRDCRYRFFPIDSGWGRFGPKEHLTWGSILGSQLRNRHRCEACLLDQLQPHSPAEQPQSVGFMKHPDRAIGLTEKEAVIGQTPGIALGPIVRPLQVSSSSPVRGIGANRSVRVIS
jgi:hypothetical protein